MDLEQLEYFVRVAELGSFTKAAIALDVALSETFPSACRRPWPTAAWTSPCSTTRSLRPGAPQGNYEPVAEALLEEMNLGAYFMEYDDDRSGDFRPLRYLPKGKTVVLGLVTTKFGELESKDVLKRRIDEASKYAPLEQLALSPQCGFSSTVHGNNIAVEAQRQKLRLVVETAQEVWGAR